MQERKIRLRHRFFFALFPPPVLARQIVHAMEPYAGGARMMRPERLHITLDILDDFPDYPDGVVEALTAAGAAVSATAFTVTLERLSGGAHTIALRPRGQNKPLEALRRAIAAARTAQGIPERKGYAFSPHLTLVYRDGAPINQLVAPVSWQAEEFVLVHSLIGQTEHRVIGRWPLTPAESLAEAGQLALF